MLNTHYIERIGFPYSAELRGGKDFCCFIFFFVCPFSPLTGSCGDVLLQHLQPATVQLLQRVDSQGQNVLPPRDCVPG